MKFTDYSGVEFTSLDFGTLDKGETRYYPSSDYFYLKNTGDYAYYVAWTLTGFPTGVTFKIYVNKGGWVNDVEDNYELAEGEIFSQVIDSGQSLNWAIKIVTSSSSEVGNFSPTLTWTGYETSSG